jgi:hypothetical protein
MSNEQKIKVATEYVDKQLATMKKYGSEPRDLSPQEHRSLVEEIVSALPSK